MSLFKIPVLFFQNTNPPLDEDEKQHTYFERMLVGIPAAPQKVDNSVYSFVALVRVEKLSREQSLRRWNYNILSVNVMIFVKAKANRSHQSFRFKSSHLVPKAKKKKNKTLQKKKIKEKASSIINTTKYYYYIHLYDKTENYNYDISIYILWFMFRSIEKENTAWNWLATMLDLSLILFPFFPSLSRYSRWFRPPPSRSSLTYTIHKMKFWYIHLWNLIKFVFKKKKGYFIIQYETYMTRIWIAKY